MSIGSLAIVEEWLDAVNRTDDDRLEQLTPASRDSGPRGSGRMHRHVLSEWLTRAGFSAEPMRWFCGADGNVVVEQDARWVDIMTGAEQGAAALLRSSSSRDAGSPNTCGTTTACILH